MRVGVSNSLTGSGTSEIFGAVGTATTDVTTVNIRDGQVTRFDMRIDHQAIVTSLQEEPPINCPGSPPGAVIEGHTTTQADLDAIASAVLQRFTVDRSTIADGGLLVGDRVYVQVDLRAHRRLSKAALPAGTSLHFVSETRSELQAEADRTGKNVKFIDFRSIYSDGSCALVVVGVDLVMPSANRGISLCCCTGTDVYEMHEDRWVFVRRAHESCA